MFYGKLISLGHAQDTLNYRIQQLIWIRGRSATKYEICNISENDFPTKFWAIHTPNTAGAFRKKFRRNSGKTPETLSERFLEFPSRVRLGSPKPYNSRHLRLPEHFQNSLPVSTAGGASFFRSGSGEGLSALVMEFSAVLRVFLTFSVNEWQAKSITKIHADLAFRACISSLSFFRTSGTPIRKILVHTGMLPCLAP